MRRTVRATLELTAEVEIEFEVDGDMPTQVSETLNGQTLDERFLQRAAEEAFQQHNRSILRDLSPHEFDATCYHAKVAQASGERTCPVVDPGQLSIPVEEPGFQNRWSALQPWLNLRMA